MDYRKKKITSAEGTEKRVSIEAVEAVEQAELMYFILQPDVSFVQTRDASFV
jgi:hypothetical protein